MSSRIERSDARLRPRAPRSGRQLDHAGRGISRPSCRARIGRSFGNSFADRSLSAIAERAAAERAGMLIELRPGPEFATRGRDRPAADRARRRPRYDWARMSRIASRPVPEPGARRRASGSAGRSTRHRTSPFRTGSGDDAAEPIQMALDHRSANMPAVAAVVDLGRSTLCSAPPRARAAIAEAEDACRSSRGRAASPVAGSLEAGAEPSRRSARRPVGSAHALGGSRARAASATSRAQSPARPLRRVAVEHRWIDAADRRSRAEVERAPGDRRRLVASGADLMPIAIATRFARLATRPTLELALDEWRRMLERCGGA